MISTLIKIWTLKDLRKRILYTISLLVIFRILAHIPVPGADIEELRKFFNRNEIFGILDLFSGGAMKNFSIVMMGVGPYITSSIIFQLLVIIVPSLEALNKEGEYGRGKINHYTRMATVPLAFMQSYAMIMLLKSQNVITTMDPWNLAISLISISAGTILLMWIGELISENGLGNGISLIITLGILGSLPGALGNTFSLIDQIGVVKITIFAALAVVVTGLIVYINGGERQIPVTYARRVRGGKSYGGAETYLPLKVIMAGVIPIIFAISMMIFPPAIARFFENARSEWVVNVAKHTVTLFNNNTFYTIAYFLLVVFFTYFYTSVVFQPTQVAENLQKQGGFIPGIRPGEETANYLNYIVYRIVLFGAIFLGLIAVLPYLIKNITDIGTMSLGGTGILIVVSVVLETSKQIKAQLTMRTYDNY